MTLKNNTNTGHHLEPLADYVFDLLRQGESHLHLNNEVVEFCEALLELPCDEAIQFKTGTALKNSKGQIELYPNDCNQYWIAG